MNYDKKLGDFCKKINYMSRKEVMKNRIFDAINALRIGKYELASPSLLQRRLRLSYYQAVRLMKKLETLNIVGPSRGKKPRIIL